MCRTELNGRSRYDRRGRLEPVQWAQYRKAAPIEHVCIDHRGLDVRVPEQLLHRPNVLPALQQMRGKTVAQRMRCSNLAIPAVFTARLKARCTRFSSR